MPKIRPFFITLSSAKRFKRLVGNSRKPYGLSSGLVVLRPKESVGEHSTKDREEIIIILKGKARVRYGKKGCFILAEKSFAYFPCRTKHNVENVGSGLLEYTYITARVAAMGGVSHRCGTPGRQIGQGASPIR
jgi:mannose-6-phosphate isomerase-like protein (cupin superfamily)